MKWFLGTALTYLAGIGWATHEAWGSAHLAWWLWIIVLQWPLWLLLIVLRVAIVKAGPPGPDYQYFTIGGGL